MRKFCTLTLVLYLQAHACFADEIRPGYLSLTEQPNSIFSVLWKQPQNQGASPLTAHLPPNCINKSPVNSRSVRGATVAQWLVSCRNGIRSRVISIDGLQSTQTDVLIQIQWLDSTSNSAMLTPSDSRYVISDVSTRIEIVTSYFLFGIEHILAGTDHLLFVFTLLLIVTNTHRLIITITSFTVAHSITLAASTLKLFSLPQPPVEAAIALSIMFLAAEVLHGQRGKPGAAARWPWMIAFIFGLLHGFGFAGALAELGLPQDAIPLALIFFNLGVEAGQLIFVGCVVALGFILKRFAKLLSANPLFAKQYLPLIVYIIGGVASFWMIQRVAAF